MDKFSNTLAFNKQAGLLSLDHLTFQYWCGLENSRLWTIGKYHLKSTIQKKIHSKDKSLFVYDVSEVYIVFLRILKQVQNAKQKRKTWTI